MSSEFLCAPDAQTCCGCGISSPDQRGAASIWAQPDAGANGIAPWRGANNLHCNDIQLEHRVTEYLDDMRFQELGMIDRSNAEMRRGGLCFLTVHGGRGGGFTVALMESSDELRVAFGARPVGNPAGYGTCLFPFVPVKSF